MFSTAHVTDNRIARTADVTMGSFEAYLDALGAQTISVSIPGLIDSMIEAYDECRYVSQQFESFAWPKSSDFRGDLEAFILTRECWFYHPQYLPVVQVTFMTMRRPRYHGESSVAIHYAWNPPVVNFSNLQDVFQEHGDVSLAPSVGSVAGFGEAHSDATYTARTVEYHTELPQIAWLPARKCLEGRWPSSCATNNGAEKMGYYTVLLSVAAIITNYFPGGSILQRNLRAALPLTIMRKADDCAEVPTLVRSPTEGIGNEVSARVANEQSHWSCGTETSARVSGTTTRPEAFVDEHSAWSTQTPTRDTVVSCTTTPTGSPPRIRRLTELSPVDKALAKLLARKAEGATSPLALNALSMARIWEATAPSEAIQVQCWPSAIKESLVGIGGRKELRDLVGHRMPDT
jgi:hypothetical protein